jgi:hypothetical protein
MTLTDRIEYDVQCLNTYFCQLFEMAKVAGLQEMKNKTSAEASEYFLAHNVTAFIRPDMVCNIYSLVDFWLPVLCQFHEKKMGLTLGHKDIKGSSDLNAYHKYLTKVAGLSLQRAKTSYDHLNNLRMVRNCCIHNGGHIKDEQQVQRFEKMPGITVFGSLVLIADTFVWASMDHAKSYLCAVAKA